MDEIENDKRFSHILTNPKYFKMGRKSNKLKVDSRFKEMFDSKNFKVKYTVDSRGRPWISSTNEDLKKYYDLSLSEESDDEKVVEHSKTKIKSKKEFSLKSESSNLEPLNKKESILKNDKKKNITSIEKVKKSKNNADNNQDNTNNSNKSKKVIKDAIKISSSKEKFNKNYSDSSNDDLTDEDNIDKFKNDKEGDNVEYEEDNDESDDQNDDIEDDEDDESEDDNDNIPSTNDISHAWGELDCDATRTDSTTSRLALCNMDWDRIKANDILVMLNSFKPENGTIKCVKIFLSEYGKQRLELENLKGPPELTQNSTKLGDSLKGDIKVAANDDDNDDDEDDDDEDDDVNINLPKQNAEGAKFDREKLRQYQFSRLKYYYAIVECDSSTTADCIYQNCNGVEYESSANVLDLRFVPDDMTFDDEPVSSSTTLPCLGTYKPTLFTNTALHQSNVELTWDETPVDRVAVTMRDFSKVDFENMDVKDYLASASEEEGDEIDKFFDDNLEKEVGLDDRIKKYKDLLRDVDEASDQSDCDMEITWEPGLKETVEQKLEEKKSNELTPWEKYLDKKSKKRKIKKNKDKNDLVDEDDTKKNNLNDKKRQKKKNLITEQEQAELELLVMDSKSKVKKSDEKKKNKKNKKQTTQSTAQTKGVDGRFKELTTDPRFNVDPTANEYSKINKIK